MNKKILFSPVGGTDPMPQSNYMDGSLLHICRVYSPDKVYMYMSKEIIENHRKDNRYLYCLKKLDELQGKTTEYVIIEREDLDQVQVFDYFFDEFKPMIQNIIDSMDDTDTLFINVSSGTPAMKSALFVIVTMIDLDCKVIQVVTPIRGMNEHNHKDYDMELLWEMNEDNNKDFENRCQEVHCPSLSIIKNEEIIKKHILAYDYAAAFSVASTLPTNKTELYLPLIEAAQHRYLLDFNSISKMNVSEIDDFFPVKSSGIKKYFEYSLNLEIKCRRKEYADFIRAISPLIADIFELILKHQFEIVIDEYCIYDNKQKIRKWDKKKLNNSEILKILENAFNEFNFGPVYSSQLVFLIEYYADKNNNLIPLVKELRDVERNIRNKTAHEIISVTDNFIKKETGFTSKQIMDKIRKILGFAGINIKKEYWDAYDNMNSIIINAIYNYKSN
ncbi:MAG: type III-A CRISPR-associated CARF protein Csm6 [Anaerovoracaceae bacterium]